jgi:hypothetical protein
MSDIWERRFRWLLDAAHDGFRAPKGWCSSWETHDEIIPLIDEWAGITGDQPTAVQEIGAVLTYRCEGSRGVSGQTMGADGAGEFAVLFEGEAYAANDAARAYLDGLRKAGYRITSATLVLREEGCSGPLVRVVRATDKPSALHVCEHEWKDCAWLESGWKFCSLCLAYLEPTPDKSNAKE